MIYKKELIEVALPLDAVNKIGAKLHDRWARAEAPQ